MGLTAGVGRHALHEIEDAFGRAAFLLQHGSDDFAGFSLAEPALALEGFRIALDPDTSVNPLGTSRSAGTRTFIGKENQDE